MAINGLKQRLGRIEKTMRITLPVAAVETSSHAELARRLYLSRQILDAEREALNFLKKLQAAPMGRPSPGSIREQELSVQWREQEVAEIEHQCLAAGMTKEGVSEA